MCVYLIFFFSYYFCVIYFHHIEYVQNSFTLLAKDQNSFIVALLEFFFQNLIPSQLNMALGMLLCQVAKKDNLKKVPTRDTVRKILMGQVQHLYY